jgi:hypothetical protein
MIEIDDNGERLAEIYQCLFRLSGFDCVLHFLVCDDVLSTPDLAK